MAWEHIEEDFIRKAIETNDTDPDTLGPIVDTLSEYVCEDVANDEVGYYTYRWRRDHYELADACFDEGNMAMCLHYIKEYFKH